MSWASTIAIQTRWRWPPESWSSGRSRSSAVPVASSAQRDPLAIVRRLRAAEALVRVAPARDEVADRQPLGRDGRLRQEADAARDLARRQRRDVGAVEQDGAAPAA